MANSEAIECANQDFNSIAMNAIISVGVAWLLGLSVFRSNQISTVGPKTSSAEIVGEGAPEVSPEIVSVVAAEELLNFDPLVESDHTWSPADILKITDADEIFKFALDYNKQSPEVASKNLRYVVKQWGAKPETKIIWMTAIKKIESHNDGQAMANLFFGGEVPIIAYANVQGQPVSCWEDSVKLPSQMYVG